MSKAEIWQLLDSRGIGGIETHVAILAATLRDAGCDAHVVLLRDYGGHPLAETWRRQGVPLHILAGGWRGLWAALRERRPGLLHTHGYKAGVLGRMAGRLRGIPVVSSHHAGEPGQGRVAVYQWLDRWTSLMAENIAVTEAIAAGLPGPASVVANFVTVPDFVARYDHVGTVAFVGRLSEEKGPDLFCHLADQVQEVPFEIFGDGPLRPALEARWGGRIAFRGMVRDMTSHWPGIGLLCMPSRHEGLPMAALEAMARGVPVAAFAVGGLPGLVTREAGWLVEANNVSALAASIRDWSGLTGSRRCDVALAARQTVIERFSSTAALPRILEAYRSAGWP